MVEMSDELEEKSQNTKKDVNLDGIIAKIQKDVYETLRIQVIKETSFRGPIPHPEILKGYDGVVKDGAERIFAMAEKQSNHRMQLERRVIEEELKQSRLGQLFGFIIGMLGLGLAVLLAMFGHETVASIFGTTTIIGLVTVFVLGKRAQQKDIASKTE
jgi:uncharacterized membrane protein